jgi:two-component system sensor histidine kinase DesK
VHGFRSATLADELLRARAVLLTAGVEPRFEAATGLADAIGADKEHAAAMILREAVTNVIRHAKATRCRVRAHCDDGVFVLRIEDDGAGRHAAEGAGIESMRARAREIGGTLEHGEPGGPGVAVTLRVPLNEPA